MSTSQLAVRINKRVKNYVVCVCNSYGLKVNRFVEDALLDKLEELEDSDEIKKIRLEPRRSFNKVLKELGLRKRPLKRPLN